MALLYDHLHFFENAVILVKRDNFRFFISSKKKKHCFFLVNLLQLMQRKFLG